MSGAEFREFVARQWALVTVRPPVVGELHPASLEGVWVTLSLSEPQCARSWLHFRKPGNFIEVAYSDSFNPTLVDDWDAIDLEQIPAVLREFAENFKESRGEHAGITD